MKNKLLADAVNSRGKKEQRILGHTPAAAQTTQEGESAQPIAKKSLKSKDEQVREQVRKRERKSLMKSLQLAQMSTASMGKFDKKAGKKEVDLNTEKMKKKKRSNSKLSAIESHMGKGTVEKDRNLNILRMM